MPPPDDLSVALITALSAVWTAIRRNHPEVPAVVLLPAPAQKGRESVLGHFAALRWRPVRSDEGAHYHEVVVVAENLNRGTLDLLDTLLHEAAHAVNHERKVFDCSRSQYHNRHFKRTAEELGLLVKQVPHYGFADTSLAPGTFERYSPEVATLEQALIHRERPPSPSAPPGTTPVGGEGEDDNGDTGNQGSRSRKAVCQCPFIIRVAKKTLSDTTIRCESCGEPFRLV